MGGADQWGNITAGLELIRRTSEPRTDGLAQRLRAGVPAAARPIRRQVREVRERRLRLAPPGRDVAVRLLPALAEHGRPRHLGLPALVHAVRAGRGSRRSRRRSPRRPGSARRSASSPSTSRRASTAFRPPTRRRPTRRRLRGPSRCADPAVLRAAARRDSAGSRPTPQIAASTRPRRRSRLYRIVTSASEARRLIQNGGLTINGELVKDATAAAPATDRRRVVGSPNRQASTRDLELADSERP